MGDCEALIAEGEERKDEGEEDEEDEGGKVWPVVGVGGGRMRKKERVKNEKKRAKDKFAARFRHAKNCPHTATFSSSLSLSHHFCSTDASELDDDDRCRSYLFFCCWSWIGKGLKAELFDSLHCRQG